MKKCVCGFVIIIPTINPINPYENTNSRCFWANSSEVHGGLYLIHKYRHFFEWIQSTMNSFRHQIIVSYAISFRSDFLRMLYIVLSTRAIVPPFRGAKWFFLGLQLILALEPHLIQPLWKTDVFSWCCWWVSASPHAACMHESLRLSSDKLTCRF